jgi:hypothetical protein
MTATPRSRQLSEQVPPRRLQELGALDDPKRPPPVHRSSRGNVDLCRLAASGHGPSSEGSDQSGLAPENLTTLTHSSFSSGMSWQGSMSSLGAPIRCDTLAPRGIQGH